MCARLVFLKAGVTIPQSDISACHVLSKRGADSTYILRISNMKPGSSWDILAAGMLTGKNKETKANFSDANVFLNFQLTRKKGNMLREVRKAKADRKVMKYGTDQNGRITVRVRQNSPWVEVASVEQLEEYIASPPVNESRQQQSSNSG